MINHQIWGYAATLYFQTNPDLKIQVEDISHDQIPAMMAMRQVSRS